MVDKRNLVKVTFCRVGYLSDGSFGNEIIPTTQEGANTWIAELVHDRLFYSIMIEAMRHGFVSVVGRGASAVDPWCEFFLMPRSPSPADTQVMKVFKLAPGQECYTLPFGLGRYRTDPQSLYIRVYPDDTWHRAWRRIQSVLRRRPSPTAVLVIDVFHTSADKRPNKPPMTRSLRRSTRETMRVEDKVCVRHTGTQWLRPRPFP